jgi:hypothetical protein
MVLRKPVAGIAIVDGDHRYEPCRVDLNACQRLLRPGAGFWAHDYNRVPGTLMTGKPGVRRAVDEFCQKRGYTISRKAGSLVPA